MKITGKIAVAVGLIALISSCQKDDMPSPYGCPSQKEDAADVRMGNPTNDQNNPGALNGDGFDLNVDSLEIVGGGDDDRDGGGIVGGGDGDRDGEIVSGGDGDRDGGN